MGKRLPVTVARSGVESGCWSWLLSWAGKDMLHVPVCHSCSRDKGKGLPVCLVLSQCWAGLRVWRQFHISSYYLQNVCNALGPGQEVSHIVFSPFIHKATN